MRSSCSLFAIAVGGMLFGSTTALVVTPQAVDLVERSGDLTTRMGDCIEMHVWIENNPFTTNGDCATFQLWRNGVEVKPVASTCQSYTNENSVYHVQFSDYTTASTTGRGDWISVSGVEGNLNLVAWKSGHQNQEAGSAVIHIGEFELAGNTANLDAAGCDGYHNARLCNFGTWC